MEHYENILRIGRNTRRIHRVREQIQLLEQNLQIIRNEYLQQLFTMSQPEQNPTPRTTRAVQSPESSTTSYTERHREELRVPAPKAPTYDGLTDVDTFIWIYKDYCTFINRTEHESIRTLTFALQGIAREVYYHKWRGTHPPTLEAALESVRIAFMTLKRSPNDYTGIMSMKQNPGEPIEDYSRRFDTECMQIPGIIPEEILISSFTQGLSYKIRLMVQERLPHQYYEAVTAARSAEKYQKEKQAWKAEEKTRSKHATAKNVEITEPTRQLAQRPPWRPNQQNPRFQMGGVPQFRPQGGQPFNRPFIPNNQRWPVRIITPPTTEQELKEDPELTQLREQFAKLAIGSIQREQIRD